MGSTDLLDTCSFISDVGYPKSEDSDECSSWTSIELHGLGQVIAAQNRRSRGLWSLLVICGTLVSVINTKNTFGAYLENSSATHITVQQKQRMRFPSIYVCPKYPDALNQSLVREDIRQHLGPYWAHIDELGIRQMVAYAIAGAGFDNMDDILKKFTSDNRMRLSRLFRKWVGKRSYEVFYKTLFETHGYQCDDLFQSCSYGDQPIKCCDIFEQSYVMLRGRCFRLKEFYQTDPDQEGKLVLMMKQLSSWFVDKDGKQPQAVLYLTDPDAEAAQFPRYYFRPNDWNKLILNKRNIKMLDSNPHCQTRCRRCGKSKCYIKHWIKKRILNPLNCTLYYQQHHAPGYQVCNPWEIVTRYFDIINLSTSGAKCLPACDREDYYVHLETKYDKIMTYAEGQRIAKDIKANGSPAFRVDIFYTDMEVETYEEVVTTTVPGFIAELGGQSNLFLGFSLITAIHALCVLGLKTGHLLMCTLRRICPCLSIDEIKE